MAILHIGPSADVSICRRRKGQNLQAGHVGYVLMSVSHFIENIGDTPSKTLSGFARYMDVSLAQWMTLTPHELVEARLKLNRDMLDGLPKDKRPVV